ncbi:MAG: glycosyltransferase family 4 protein [Candidatus Eisenbacteria bacterium]|nr:glycosyltransferase family 4 protein [Candidatus Eisenbacteria bacterium]
MAFRNDRLRVLQVTPTLGPGGAEHVAAFLATAFMVPRSVALCSAHGGTYAQSLHARHVTFRVFEPAWRQVRRNNVVLRKWRGWRAQHLQMPALSSQSVFLAPQKGFPQSIPGFPEWFAAILDRSTYQVVHLHQLSCLGLGEIAKAKVETVIYGQHNILSERHGQEDIVFLKQQLQKVDRVVCASKTCLDDFVRVIGYPCHNTVVIPNPSFLASGLKRNIKEIRTVGTVSNLNLVKGIDILLEAWKLIMKRWNLGSLHIAGGSHGDIAYWRSVAEKMNLGSTVHFLGAPTSEAGMHRFYDTIDAVVVPSRTESFPLLAVEALSRGIPVIASDIPALRETVGDAGLFFPTEDPVELSNCVERLVKDPALVARLSHAGHERWREKYSPGMIKSSYEHVYRGASQR